MSEQFKPVSVNQGQNQLLLPAHVADEQAAQFMAPHEFSVNAQEMKAQELVLGTNGLGSIRAEAHGDNPEDAKAADLDRSIRDMLDPKNIIDLKAQLDHTSDRVTREGTHAVDKRLDKDGAKAQSETERREELKQKMIARYTQVGAKKDEPREVPQRVIDEISRNVDLSYDELERRIKKSEAKKVVSTTATPAPVPVTGGTPDAKVDGATDSPDKTFAKDILATIHKAEEAKRKGNWKEYNDIMAEMGDRADKHAAETGKPVSDEFINRVDTRLDQASDGRIERSDRANFMIDGVQEDAPEAPRTRRQRIRDAWNRGLTKLRNPILLTRPGNALRNWTTVETENGREFKKGAKVAAIIGGIAVAAGGYWLATRGGASGGGNKANHITENTPRGGGNGGHGVDTIGSRGGNGGHTVGGGGLVEQPGGGKGAELTGAHTGGKGGDNSIENAIAGRTSEITHAGGKYPWNRAAELYGENNATARIMSAADKLRASGAKVVWHGDPLTSKKAWVSVDGVSDTNAVWGRLARAMAEDDAKRFFENAAS